MPHTIMRIVASCIVLAALAAGLVGGPAAAGSIYDTDVENRLTLTPQQRSQVVKIVAESGRKARAVFQKYGIDPNARPVFDKLLKASDELRAIEQQERRQMVKILTPEQYKEYSRILNETHTRVRKAAQ